MFKKGFLLISVLIITQAQATQVPELVDIKLVGNKENAHFEPANIELFEGASYIFVIDNPYEQPYQFVAPSLASGIVTQYIQGSSAVTQTSVQIPAESKIQWVFRVTKAGEHTFSAKTQGMASHQIKPGKITVVGLSPKQESTMASQNSPIEVKVPDADYIARLEGEHFKDELSALNQKEPAAPSRRRFRGKPS